jgi:uncharacterized membrane protein
VVAVGIEIELIKEASSDSFKWALLIILILGGRRRTRDRTEAWTVTLSLVLSLQLSLCLPHCLYIAAVTSAQAVVAVIFVSRHRRWHRHTW